MDTDNFRRHRYDAVAQARRRDHVEIVEINHGLPWEPLTATDQHLLGICRTVLVTSLPRGGRGGGFPKGSATGIFLASHTIQFVSPPEISETGVGVIYFVTPRRGGSGVDLFLETNGRGLVDRMRVMEYETLLTSAEAPPGTYVLAGIDQLDSAARNRLIEVYEDLSSAPQVQFVNSPRGTLLRTELLATLHQRGFNVHRVVKATDSLRELRYPVFIREEQGHDGGLSSLLHTPTEVDREVALQVARGLRLRDLRVIEFLDTADTEGYFRTYGAFIVGTEIIPIFMSYGRRWMLKQGGAEFGLAMLLEERRYVLENPHAEALRPIFQLANVEYGRIDYSLHNGKIETWEINLNPDMEWDSDRGELSEELWQSREPARQYFNQRFQAAFEALDTLGDSVPAAMRRSSERREALRSLPGQPERDARWRVLKWFFRPFKPVALRVLRTLAPLLLRVRRHLN